MRLISFLDRGTARPAIVDGDFARPLRLGSMLEYLALPATERAAVPADEPIPLADVALDAPVRPRKNVFCVGRNYMDHAAEIARANGIALSLPSVPTFFTKAPTAIAAPDEELVLSAGVSSEYDWEAELGVVIGARCRDVPQERALEMVFGYTCLNDVTARDLQREHKQWFKGKSLDHTCPLGPWIVSADEVGDPQALDIALRVNTIEKQRSNTGKMIFPVAAVIASLSRGMTLEPGDVIATGTPDGVGMARTPPEFLADGDVMEVEIARVGRLRSPVRIVTAARVQA